MADLRIRALRKGLSPEERKELTFKELRLTRLEALSGGLPLERADLNPEFKGQKKKTTAPTLSHLAHALEISPTTLRSYERGINAPRWEIHQMVDFAKAIGLTVEELNIVVQNTLRAKAEGRLSAASTKED